MYQKHKPFYLSVITAMILVALALTTLISAQQKQDNAKCPQIKLTAPESASAGAPFEFKVEVSGGDENVTPTYNWSVSSGKISLGQGTTSIWVDTTGLGGKTVTATLEVGGYDRECKATNSVSAAVKE